MPVGQILFANQQLPAGSNADRSFGCVGRLWAPEQIPPNIPTLYLLHVPEGRSMTAWLLGRALFVHMPGSIKRRRKSS